MSHNKVQVSNAITVHQGYLRIDKYNLKHTIFSNEWTGMLSREVLEKGLAVAILPYDPKTNHVVLIEQFRIGGFTANKTSPWQIECVAGVVEKDQTVVDTVQREVMEETGLEILDLKPIYRYLSSPGFTSETIEMFCGKVDSARVSGIHGLASEGEFIRAFSMPFEAAFSLLNSNQIENGMTIIALQWLKLNLKQIRNEWQK